jgi:GNAT superfamily N-acetyltransferase
MSSLYARFVKETVGWHTLEDEDSFSTYEIQKVGPVSCLKIIEMYVAPEARGKNKWREISDNLEEVAKKEGCRKISAQISKTTSEFTQQRTAHICRIFGMELTYEDIYQIIYSRDVKYE